MILLEYQNIKAFLQKAMFQFGLKKLMLLQKLKMLGLQHKLKVKKLLEPFTKRNCNTKKSKRI